MYYNLHDTETEELLGTIKITNNFHQKNSSGIILQPDQAHDEIWESWETYNKFEEHELDFRDVDEFVEWNNKNWVTQIKRITMDFIQPSIK